MNNSIEYIYSKRIYSKVILQVQLNFALVILLLISPLVLTKKHCHQLCSLPLDCKFFAKWFISVGCGGGPRQQSCS